MTTEIIGVPGDEKTIEKAIGDRMQVHVKVEPKHVEPGGVYLGGQSLVTISCTDPAKRYMIDANGNKGVQWLEEDSKRRDGMLRLEHAHIVNARTSVEVRYGLTLFTLRGCVSDDPEFMGLHIHGMNRHGTIMIEDNVLDRGGDQEGTAWEKSQKRNVYITSDNPHATTKWNLFSRSTSEEQFRSGLVSENDVFAGGMTGLQVGVVWGGGAGGPIIGGVPCQIFSPTIFGPAWHGLILGNTGNTNNRILLNDMWLAYPTHEKGGPNREAILLVGKGDPGATVPMQNIHATNNVIGWDKNSITTRGEVDGSVERQIMKSLSDTVALQDGRDEQIDNYLELITSFAIDGISQSDWSAELAALTKAIRTNGNYDTPNYPDDANDDQPEPPGMQAQIDALERRVAAIELTSPSSLAEENRRKIKNGGAKLAKAAERLKDAAIDLMADEDADD